MFAALSPGASRIIGLLDSADVRATANCLERLGMRTEPQADGSRVVHGVLPFVEPTDVLDAANSGTTMRLMTGLIAAQGVYAVMTGDHSLRRRPMRRVIDPLRKMGAKIYGRDNDRYAPLCIRPTGTALQGISYEMPIASAQVKSALALAGLFAEGPTTIIEPLPSRDHTERMLAYLGAPVIAEAKRHTIAVQGEGLDFQGFAPVEWQVPGDFSSAAFHIVAALLSPESEIRIENVGLNPLRTGLMTALQSVGGRITVENSRLVCGEPMGDLVVQASELTGDLTITAAQVPAMIDEIPVLAIAGLFLKGTLTVRGAEELRKKESDRIAAMAQELARVGVSVTVFEDGFQIQGSPDRDIPAPAEPFDAHHDHRIAMSLMVLKQIVHGRSGKPPASWHIQGEDCIGISYPGFPDDLARLQQRLVAQEVR
jgi:3-phosphoshikimate 1-carboxyvinyltransferase